MKKVTVFLGETTSLAKDLAIKFIKPYFNDLSEKIYVVVPDKLSLEAEKSIFENLGEEVYFNIEVMGINNFVQKVLKDSGLDIFCYSKEESLFLVRRAIQKVKDQFLCFGKRISNNLCEEMLETITQLKTSGISADEFFVTNENLNLNKFHDIKLVYSQYESLLDGKQDSGELLNLFCQFAKSSDLLKNTRVLFVGFDSLTNQGLMAMESTINFAKDFSISVVSSKNKNAYLYDRTILDKLKSLESEGKISVNYISENVNTQNIEKDYLFKNIYTSKILPELESNEYCKIVEATTMSDEIKFAAKTILYQVKVKNKCFEDFAVVCPEEYFYKIDQVFGEYKINYFLDKPKNLSEFDYCKFITNLLDFYDEKNKEKLLNLIKFNFLNLDKQSINKFAENLLFNDEINFDNNFLCEDENLQNIVNNFKIIENSINNYKSSKNTLKISNLCQIILQVFAIFNFENSISVASESLEQKGEIFLSKAYSQLFEKLNDAILSLNNFLPDEEVSLFDFKELFTSLLVSRTIKNPPITLDCVQIISPSGFCPTADTLFVLGANEGSLPVAIKDAGLISDKEIDGLDLAINVGPTVKTINKRNKYKLYETLFCAKNNLYITYHTTLSDGKNAFASTFVGDIVKCFKTFKLLSTKNLFSLLDTVAINQNKLAFNFACFEELKNSYGLFPLGINKNIAKSILSETGHKFCYGNAEYISSANKLFFPKSTTKVSQLEEYFACPKANYFAYGLNLQKKKSDKVESADNGTFIHKVLQDFIWQNENKFQSLTSSEITNWVVMEIDRLKTDDKFVSIYKKSNSLILSHMTDELVRVCSYLCDEQKISDFKANRKFLEYRFNTENALTLNSAAGNINLVGIIDRVDFYGDYFRIIDYKTGQNATTDGLKDIYTGKKIQTVLYFKALEQITAKKCFGAFYFPIKAGYLQNDETAYKLSGIYLKDIDLVMSADKTLNIDNPTSAYFNVRLTKGDYAKTGKLSVNGQITSALTEVELNNISDYTKELSQKAIDEISSGFIASCPTKSACEYCDFSNICKDHKKELLQRSFDSKVTKESFVKGAKQWNTQKNNKK